MDDLVINHTVPLHGTQEGGALNFNQWIPEGPEQALTASLDDLCVSIWLDRTCVYSMGEEMTDDLLSRWLNIPVMKVFIDVRVDALPKDLADFIQNQADWPRRERILESPDSGTCLLAEAYRDLGWKVLRSVLTVSNRIVAWAYAERRHHWLRERDVDAKIMMSRNVEFGARARFASGP